MRNIKPIIIVSNKPRFSLQRWSGKAWYDTLCSPYKNMQEIKKHLEKYSWHYTKENPYRIKNYKFPKKYTLKTAKRKYFDFDQMRTNYANF